MRGVAFQRADDGIKLAVMASAPISKSLRFEQHNPFFLSTASVIAKVHLYCSETGFLYGNHLLID